MPDTNLAKLAWSFAEPVPSSPQQLIARLEAYAGRLQRKVDQRELRRVFPGDKLDVIYYDSRQPPWARTPKIARISGGGRHLTYAEIVFQLHNVLHEQVKDRDHHYFEGLHLMDNQRESGVPAYQLYLGS